MPRPLRQIDSQSFYHITARGSRRRRVFRSHADYEKYRSLIREIKQKAKFLLFHYVLMPNHIHLIVRPNWPSVAGFLQPLQSRYAIYYCKKYGVSGQIWQAHPKVIRIDSDPYLLACGNYIEMNPVRAKLAADPGDWLYSSYRHYAYGEKDDLVDDDPLYSTFGSSAAERQRRYREWIGKTRAAR